MPSNIDLVRYRRYGDDLLLLEQVASSAVEVSIAKPPKKSSTTSGDADGILKPDQSRGSECPSRPLSIQKLDQCYSEVHDWYETLRAYALGLGDGAHEHISNQYIASRGLKNFAYIAFRPTLNKIIIDLHLDESTVADGSGYIGRIKSGWSEVDILKSEDVERALPLIAKSSHRS